jgi:hypothetical protein
LAAMPGSVVFDALLDALDDVLPQHAMACCLHRDGKWIEGWNGKVAITQESCQCGDRLKMHRALLARFRPNSDKAFRPLNTNYPERNSR